MILKFVITSLNLLIFIKTLWLFPNFIKSLSDEIKGRKDFCLSL